MPTRDNAIERFWMWFAANGDRMKAAHAAIRDVDGEEAARLIEPILTDVMTALHGYDERLFPYFGMNEAGEWELIITAEGDVEAFDSVFDLVGKAPVFPGWSIVALKPREPAGGGEFLCEDLGIDPETTRYLLEMEGGKAAIYLVFEDWTDEQEEAIHGAACLLLDSLLGERDMAEKVTNVVCGPATGLKPGLDLRPLSELPVRFDQAFAN